VCVDYHKMSIITIILEHISQACVCGIRYKHNTMDTIKPRMTVKMYRLTSSNKRILTFRAGSCQIV